MLVYRLFTWLYPKILWLLSFINPKAKAWLSGRRNIFKRLSSVFHKNDRPVVWMHCASLGEFEQGRPVLESIRRNYPGHCILLTFFSPSGYEVRKNYEGADHVFYLPMDTPASATRFLNIVQPSIVLFVKYEFWYYYLNETRQRNIPLLLVSGIFRSNQPFFRWWGNLHRKMLSFFTVLFVQNTASARLLSQLDLDEKTIISGDTRFDRVIDIAKNTSAILPIEHFCAGATTIVAGSTWTEDDEELDHYANTHPEIKFIIAPHDLDEERLEECMQLYQNAVLYSVYREAFESGKEIDTTNNVLIIDNMGMLSQLYRYATLCYVGGGFGGDGIHNILEAAVYSRPVVFGPVYDKFFEAEELLDRGGAFTVVDALSLEQVFDDLLGNNPLYHSAGTSAGDYVRARAGATAQVIRYIQEKRLLIN